MRERKQNSYLTWRLKIVEEALLMRFVTLQMILNAAGISMVYTWWILWGRKTHICIQSLDFTASAALFIYSNEKHHFASKILSPNGILIAITIDCMKIWLKPELQSKQHSQCVTSISALHHAPNTFDRINDSTCSTHSCMNSFFSPSSYCHFGSFSARYLKHTLYRSTSILFKLFW